MDISTILSNGDSGFGMANEVVLEDLHKALTAGYGTDSSLFTGGRAIIPESLDNTLVSVLHTQDEVKLFKALKKEPVTSTVHEYNKRDEVGNDDGAWVAEGGDSEEKDQNIFRRTVNMKYLQTLRKVTLQIATAKTIEDATAIEQEAGALWIIRNVEKGLFGGNSDCVAEEPDGLDKLITGNSILDLRGDVASASSFEDIIGEGTRRIRDSFGKATHFFSSTMIMQDIQTLLRDRIRVPVTTGAPGSGNYVFDVYPTKFGKPLLEDDVFIREGDVPVASSLTAKRPDQPSIALARQAVTGGRVSQFLTGDDGDYYYQVVASNKYGDSVASTAVQITGVLVGDEVEITITDGSIVGTCYKVYRSKKDAGDGSDCRLMFRVPKGGTTVHYDVNADLPGTSSAYILTMDPMYNAIEWNQFLPMMKFNLYPTNAAVYPFLVLLFGALNVKKEEQMVRIKNIAPSNMGWF